MTVKTKKSSGKKKLEANNALKFVRKFSCADLCLITFMAVLLAQTIYIIFFPTPVSNIDDSIDAIMRTSIASIFGYILSTNFASAKPKEKPAKEAEIQVKKSNHQVLVAFMIGMLALITMIIFRNFVETKTAPIAAISLIRDIVSGSIGFLLGVPPDEK